MTAGPHTYTNAHTHTLFLCFSSLSSNRNPLAAVSAPLRTLGCVYLAPRASDWALPGPKPETHSLLDWPAGLLGMYRVTFLWCAAWRLLVRTAVTLNRRYCSLCAGCCPASATTRETGSLGSPTASAGKRAGKGSFYLLGLFCVTPVRAVQIILSHSAPGRTHTHTGTHPRGVTPRLASSHCSSTVFAQDWPRAFLHAPCVSV